MYVKTAKIQVFYTFDSNVTLNFLTFLNLALPQCLSAMVFLRCFLPLITLPSPAPFSELQW